MCCSLFYRVAAENSTFSKCESSAKGEPAKKLSSLTYNYRPQRSRAKVMFLQASVILSGGGSPAGRTPLAGRPPSRETPQQVDPPGRETPWQGDPPGRETPLAGRHPLPGREIPQQGDTPLAGRPPSLAGRPPWQGDPPPAYGQ